LRAHVDVECELVVDGIDDLRSAKDDAQRAPHR
jgi:hypothetical protein